MVGLMAQLARATFHGQFVVMRADSRCLHGALPHPLNIFKTAQCDSISCYAYFFELHALKHLDFNGSSDYCKLGSAAHACLCVKDLLAIWSVALAGS
jgi:hypothetical protein